MTLQGRYDEFDKGRHLDQLLAEYAAGTVDPALAILVEAHLQMRKDHHDYVTGLETLAGLALDSMAPVPLTDHQARLAAILRDDETAGGIGRNRHTNGHTNGHANGHSNGHANGHTNGHAANGNGHANGHHNGHANGNGHAHANGNGHRNGHGATLFPKPLIRYVGHDLHNVPWRTRLPGFKEYRIEERDGISASLLWIRAGKPMPHHTHEGTETTLVLCGGFSDYKGAWGRGDIAICDDQDDHRPVADDDGEDCVCFAVTDAPLRLTGPIGRIVQRLIR